MTFLTAVRYGVDAAVAYHAATPRSIWGKSTASMRPCSCIWARRTSLFPSLHKLRSRRRSPAKPMRPSAAIRVSITPSLGIMGRTTTRRRRRSPTAGPANFYINSCSDLCSSPPADDPLFYELAHRIRCAFLIRVNLSSVLEFFLISGWGAWRDVAKRRRAGNQVETFGTQPETGTRFFLFGFAVTH
jgi:hypothetical protein